MRSFWSLKRHDAVGPGHGGIETAGHAAAERLDAVRHQRRRARDRDVGAERLEPVHDGARDARVRDVTDDDEPPALESSPPRRRAASAGRAGPCVGCSCAPSPALTTLTSSSWARKAAAPAEAWRSTTTSMPMATSVRNVSSSVSPLRHRGSGDSERHHGRAQPPCGQLERGARSRRVLEERVTDFHAPERRDRLRLSRQRSRHAARPIEPGLEPARRLTFEAEQVAPLEPPARSASSAAGGQKKPQRSSAPGRG
jgi:hypothetical protein